MIGERNLAPERGPSVWDRVASEADAARATRWAKILAGAAMTAAGVALAAVGATMLYRALSAGPETAWPAAGIDERGAEPTGSREDVVTRESAASFPASDAPSWTPTTGTNPDGTVH